MTGPVIETARLTLRPPAMEDFPRWAEMMADPEAQGKGYGVEAATAAIDYAFDVLGWTEVIHCIDPDNVPSQRLAERLGSRNLGPTRLPPPFDAVAVDRWGQSREQWRARART